MSHRLSILPLASVLGCVALAGGLSGRGLSSIVRYRSGGPCSLSSLGRWVAGSLSPNQVADSSCRCDPLSGGTLGEG